MRWLLQPDVHLSSHGQRPRSDVGHLLPAQQRGSVGHLHKNRSDILHFWQHGSAIDYTLLAPNGSVTNIVMESDLAAGQQLQMLVPGGYWKASELRQGEYGLISEAVCLGFDFNDHELADASQIQRDYPQHWATLKHLIAS